MAGEEQILPTSEEMQLSNDLDVFQHHANDPPTRSTRRSSILKTTIDHNEPVGKRISKRISFHNNIFCQQILADGTTQVITENLKAKLPDISASTVSYSDGKSTTRFQQTADSENIDPSVFIEEKDTKRKSTDQLDHEANQPILPKRVKKDPKLIAKSYQKFMNKTYDFQNENDYHTIFNTSVNRNGYEVAPRDSRPDVSKLFSVETGESHMDDTKILPNLSSSCAAGSIPPLSPLQEGEITRIFSESSAAMSLVDFSQNSQESEDVTRVLAFMKKEEETSANNVGNISELDTAMIIDDDLECTEDEVPKLQQKSALIPSRFVKEVSFTDISMSITVNVPSRASISTVENVPGHEPTEIESPSMSLTHFEETESSQVSAAPRTEPQINDQVVTNPEGTKCFDPQSDQAKMILETEANEVSEAQSWSNINIFSDNNTGNGMSIDTNPMDPSPSSRQEVAADSQTIDKETTAFGVESSTFQRKQTLSKVISRFSFPKSLDNILEMRKRQLNQNYLDSLTSLELSESIESILNSPSIHSPSIASPTVQRSFHTSSSRLSLSTSNCSTPKKSPGRIFGPLSQLIKDLSAKKFDSSKQTIVHEPQQVLEPEPGQKEEFETIVEETRKSEEGPTEPTLSDSSSSTISEMEIDEINFDKSYNIPMGFGEEDERNLCEDSMFEIVNKIHESSFALSPNSSFHSSFICMDDTLAMQAEDLDCKLNSFQFSDDGESSDITSQFQGVYVPLRKFDANKFQARFDLSSEDESTIYFLYDLIEVHVTFGVTARSFNGIPIKFIRKLLVKSALTNNKFIPNQSSNPFLINFLQNHQCFFECTSDLVVTCFEDNKVQLLRKHPTSDLLPELLREIAQWIMRGRDLLHEITTIANFTNCYFYQKLDNMYEFAFELSGPQRNFFLIVPFDPKTYPFQPIQPRFGFYPEDRTLVSVSNFSKALSMCIKPGKDYLQRLVDNSRKFVIFFRRIEQKKRRTLTEKKV